MSEQIIAKVGNRNISLDYVRNIIKGVPAGYEALTSTPEGKKDLLNRMIIQEMLYIDALEKGIDQEQEFIEEMEKMKYEKLKEYSAKKIIDSVSISEEALKEFYDQYKENFKTGEAVRASHILVQDKDQAQEILNEIKNGKDFAEAAKEYSECPSKDNGGDLGLFGKGQMVPEFEAAAFSLKIDELSEIVQTQFGYHIVKVTEKQEPKSLNFEKVRGQIEDHLLNVERTAKFDKVAQALSAKYPVEMNEELVKEI